ncbi:hypothetical protein RMCBS344292_03074 [Rhizopus microsporus]|nr:hypothetical protein RMCBS344292_03074 [Rhizopus microsporus]
MDKECPHCHALHWIDERQETSSLRNPSWESCCKRGSVQLQLLPDPPQYFKYLLARTDTQGRHFKDNLRQYKAAFAFTSLGCDAVSAEDRAKNDNSNNNNNRSRLNAFQIHGTLCHHHSTLIPIKGIVPSYTQSYIYNPSYNAQRLSERNENLDNEIIENPSTLLSQCNPFTCIYRHVYEILSSHESSIINSEDRANNNSSAEGGLPYIIISSSMGMHLVEGGVRRTHNLTTMEEVAAVVPIE